MALVSIKPRLKPMTQPTKTHWGNGRGGRTWAKLRMSIFVRDLFTCQHCQQLFDDKQLECDHILNTARGGTDDPANLQTLCKPCHQKKTYKESRVATFKTFTTGKPTGNHQPVSTDKNNQPSIGYVFMPEWLKPIPNATLIFGCPASGKTTWARQNAKQGVIIIDLDEIIAIQTGKPLYQKTADEYALAVRERNNILLELAKDNQPCMIILTGETKDQRTWWINKLTPATVKIMETPKDVCIQRILDDKNRPEAIKMQQIEAVKRWGE